MRHTLRRLTSGRTRRWAVEDAVVLVNELGKIRHEINAVPNKEAAGSLASMQAYLLSHTNVEMQDAQASGPVGLRTEVRRWLTEPI